MSINSNMILEHTQQKLGWPEPEEIFTPKNTAPRLTAELAQQKIGRALIELSGDKAIRVGILASSPDTTEAPLALVCQFSRPASVQVLVEAQRLAWNFSRSLLLITIEPTTIRKWSCYECPKPIEQLWPNFESTPIYGQQLDAKETPQILPAIEFDPNLDSFLNEEDAFSLSWIDLLTGAFFDRNADRFKIEERADRVLLENLRAVRKLLRDMDLEDDFSHDLLARIIFVQFLFDRKDSSGHAALDPEKLAELQANGILRGRYSTLAEILTSYEDTYALFRWLNERFNGDLFPGKGDTSDEREDGWAKEQGAVRPEHLKLLSEFVGGDLEIKKGQYLLWPQYAFDAIPLELISSIYEEFVTDAQSAHYTPGHLVDLMLDRVLPWDSEDWNLQILDPSCGSGIFLVKAYQRLIHRWKQAHYGQNGYRAEISPPILRQILEGNLFGVDNHRNAIRVASFSLYLAMCDEIDPRYYWSDEAHVSFPTLRDRTLICRDFFDEDVSGFRTEKDAGTYHLVIGNPPWGDKSISPAAKVWADEHDWHVANKDFGVLFAAKGMELTKPNGSLCVVQSAGALLYNQSGTARDLQARVFNDWKKIECVVNLAAFRPFKDVRVPTCVLIALHQEPNGEPFWYECPKPSYTPEDKGRITVDFTEMHLVSPSEVLSEPWVWSALMWGGSRDRALLRKVSYNPSVTTLIRSKNDSREGVNRGDRKKVLDGREAVRKGKPAPGLHVADLREYHILESPAFPEQSKLVLFPDNLPPNTDVTVDSRASSNFDAFEAPQLLIKSSWTKAKKRFQARLVNPTRQKHGVLCSQSYVSVHLAPMQKSALETACLAYNSNWANYFLLLTSGRFAFDRSEPLTDELRKLPLPLADEGHSLASSNTTKFRDLFKADEAGQEVTLEDIDDAVFEAFEFQKAERILIEDLVEHTLSGYKERDKSLSRRPTLRQSVQGDEPDLQRYCETLVETLAHSYGADKALAARIWSEQETNHAAPLPMRYVSIIFGAFSQRGIQIHPLEHQELRERISNLHSHLQELQDVDGYNRQIRDYKPFSENGETGLMLHLIKPDRLRHWTRSAALRDADEIARDFWTLQMGSSTATGANAHGGEAY
jgi:hypothetical protein